MNAELNHILLVEDEEAHVELVCRAFEPHRDRFHLTVAGSLAEARACLSECLPHLIIADLGLPDGLGTGLLPAEGEEFTVPLVVMTAQGDQAAAVNAMKAGALDYLVKSEEVLADTPHMAERVLREWNHITERRKSEEELTVLYDISRILSELGDYESKASRVMEKLTQSTGGDWASLRIERDNEPGLHLMAAAGPALSTSSPVPVLTDTRLLAFEALREGKIIVANNYSMEPNALPHLVDLGMKSIVLVPIKAGGHIWGLVNVVSKEINHFSPKLVRLLTAVGEGLGSLLENSRLQDETEKAHQAQAQLALESQLMAEIGQAIGSSLDIEDVYARFAELVRNILPFDWITINTVDNQTGTTTLAYVTGVDVPGRGAGTSVPLTGTFTEQVMQSSEGIIFQPDNLEREASIIQGLTPYFQIGCRSFLGVPLISRGEVIAVLNLVSTLPQAYSAQNLDLAVAIGQQIAGAIANAQQFAERRLLEKETRIVANLGRIVSQKD